MRYSYKPYFTRFLPEYGLYKYRSSQNQDYQQMPDLNMVIEPGGFYFCAYGDDAVFNTVVQYLREVVEATGQQFVLNDDVQ